MLTLRTSFLIGLAVVFGALLWFGSDSIEGFTTFTGTEYGTRITDDLGQTFRVGTKVPLAKWTCDEFSLCGQTEILGVRREPWGFYDGQNSGHWNNYSVQINDANIGKQHWVSTDLFLEASAQIPANARSAHAAMKNDSGDTIAAGKTYQLTDGACSFLKLCGPVYVIAVRGNTTGPIALIGNNTRSGWVGLGWFKSQE